ncbi:MAG: VanZ family protein [Lachnospiraceae bacterium]|nr:VanZ family protein [Lachnospiraceae bacterium]
MSNQKIIPIDQKKKGIKLAVSIVAAMFLVGLYFMIFRFSEQTGEESGALSHEVTTVIVDTVDHVAHKNWTEEMRRELINAWEHPVRKGAHFSEYALMAILLYLIWAPWIKRGFGLYLMIILWVFASAGLDELHQTFVAQRDGNFIDVMIDTSGGCCGLFICTMIRRIWGCLHGRKRKRKS